MEELFEAIPFRLEAHVLDSISQKYKNWDEEANGMSFFEAWPDLGARLLGDGFPYTMEGLFPWPLFGKYFPEKALIESLTVRLNGRKNAVKVWRKLPEEAKTQKLGLAVWLAYINKKDRNPIRFCQEEKMEIPRLSSFLAYNHSTVNSELNLGSLPLELIPAYLTEEAYKACQARAAKEQS